MTRKILIDCTNPSGAALPPEVGSGAELVSKGRAGCSRCEAFNSQGAENIAHPRAATSSLYCDDDDAAKKTVRELVADVGFDPVDAGALKNARLLDAATLLWFAASRTFGTRRAASRMLRDA
jgi:8-hydroxy-5-deazaflavin:NADPH oxidoreductase